MYQIGKGRIAGAWAGWVMARRAFNRGDRAHLNTGDALPEFAKCWSLVSPANSPLAESRARRLAAKQCANGCWLIWLSDYKRNRSNLLLAAA